MKTYILNLPSAQERRQFQMSQAERLGLEAVFMDAQTPADISESDMMAHAFSWERAIKITEVACFLSHYAAWEKVAASQEPALILEDDAILAQETPALLAWCSDLKMVDHVSLETRQRQKLIGHHSLTHVGVQACLRPLLQDRTGAAAYVLWPAGAKVLIDKFTQKGMGLADAFISSTYQLRSWQTVPALAVQADMAIAYGLPCPINATSLIAREKVSSPPTQGLVQDVQFKYRRIKSQLRMAARYISFLGRARRQYVGIDPTTF
jgi:glycosyl transferase family 25